MVDIISKVYTHRKAIASATLITSGEETIKAIRENRIEKGNVFEISKAAGLLAVKKTSDVIPDCHPMPIEYTKISHEINGNNINIAVEVHTIYKTGVEVEAMHGASVVALTMYDMLKPIDKNLHIKEIKLIEKTGGKSDFKSDIKETYTASIIVVSDSVFNKKKEDVAGQLIRKKVLDNKLNVISYDIIPDNAAALKAKLLNQAGSVNMIIISGGTALTKNDITPQVIKPLLEVEITGIMEAARTYGQMRTPYSMFSRGVAGIIKNTLVLNVPGSTNGAKETVDFLFPHILHSFKMMNAVIKK